jgi:hypothetical protein
MFNWLFSLFTPSVAYVYHCIVLTVNDHYIEEKVIARGRKQVNQILEEKYPKCQIVVVRLND